MKSKSPSPGLMKSENGTPVSAYLGVGSNKQNSGYKIVKSEKSSVRAGDLPGESEIDDATIFHGETYDMITANVSRSREEILANANRSEEHLADY